MSADRLVRGLIERGEAAATAARAAAVQAVAARVAAELPGVAVMVGAGVIEGATEDTIVLQAPGLVARAFGSRTRAGDARLLGILGDWV